MILVMFSGGLDSTAVLYEVLTETEEDIHVHHIILRNKEFRWEVESIAVKSISDYLSKHTRSFQFTQNMWGFLQFQRFIGWDMDIVFFTAAQIAKNKTEINKVAIGSRINPSYQTKRREQRMERSLAVWNACFMHYSHDVPQIIKPVGNKDKKDLINDMPEDLVRLTWSCRKPVREKQGSFKRCGTCQTCQQMKKEGIFSLFSDVYPG